MNSKRVSMKPKIFIDGEEGTTGLQIRQRLKSRVDLDLIHLPGKQRKNLDARRAALHQANLAILCLPDSVAREAVGLAEGSNTKIIDASTAHRTSKDWVYGFPEMSKEQPIRIASAQKVSNPGCYPTGVIALIRPLIGAKLIPNNFPLSIHAVSGYSGGGNTLISRMEARERNGGINSNFFSYGLNLDHKHVSEMMVHSGLKVRPIFLPSVGRFRQGMMVQIPLQLRALGKKTNYDAIYEVLNLAYKNSRFVIVVEPQELSKYTDLLDPEQVNNTNYLRVSVFGNSKNQQVVLVAQLDNLGKGAAGQAVQNLNLMLGISEERGLNSQPKN